MPVFFRIYDNRVYSAGEVEMLGWPKEDAYGIPPEYLERQEFMVMRASHGIGDWVVLSAMPRLLKEKYPNCKVVVPSAKMLKGVFGEYLGTWGYGTFDASIVPELIFANNPYVDEFVDEYAGEIFHDHYHIYDESEWKVPLLERMLIFWNFKKNERLDSSPDIYFSAEEAAEFSKLIPAKEYGYLMLSSTYELTSDAKPLLDFMKENNTIDTWLYYCEDEQVMKQFDFLKNLTSVKDMNLTIRQQLYLKANATMNCGNETGMNEATARYSPSYTLAHLWTADKVERNTWKSGNYVRATNYINI